jgi:hypothetical protein
MIDIVGMMQLGLNAVSTIERFRDALDGARAGMASNDMATLQPIADKLHALSQETHDKLDALLEQAKTE